MSDLALNQEEAQSSQKIDLEKRFGVEKQGGRVEVDIEKAVENISEKNMSERDMAYKNILSKVKSQQTSNEENVMQDASNLHQQTDRESQITHLIDIAMTKGVAYAVKVAQKAEDYYVLDQLHDRLLADELHEALVSNSLIEK